MINELKNLTNDIVGKNGWEMTRQIYERTKITSTEREMKDFYNKYVKSLRLKINEDGVFEIVVAVFHDVLHQIYCALVLRAGTY